MKHLLLGADRVQDDWKFVFYVLQKVWRSLSDLQLGFANIEPVHYWRKLERLCFCLSTVGFSVTVELMLWQLWQHSPPFANSWHSYFHISGLPHFLLIKRMLSGCPTIGRGKLRGQSSSEHNKGSGGLWLQRQLNIPPPTLSRFVYCTLSFGLLPFMKGRWANSLQIQLEHIVI